MHLQKSAQHQSGEHVGVDEEGNLCKGIVAFMLVGLKTVCRSSHQRRSVRKGVFRNSQNSQENTCARVLSGT